MNTMIELNDITQQDFLNREWVNKLLDAGVDMSDAKYWIFQNMITNVNYVTLEKPNFLSNLQENIIPTYTVSDLLSKLHEWIYLTKDGKKFSGSLCFIKDAPFYVFYYKLRTKDYDKNLPSEKQTAEWNEELMGECETPIESLASLLLQCCKSIN